MLKWCTQNLHQDSSHARTKERYQYTISVDINNTHYKRIQSLIQNHMQYAHSESAQEQRIALYIYKSYE